MNASFETPLAPPELRAKPFLYQMRPGQLFRLHDPVATPHGVQHPRSVTHGILAIMTNHGHPVVDSRLIWCVVIAAHPNDGDAGEFVGLPRDTRVDRLHMVGPLQLASEH